MTSENGSAGKKPLCAEPWRNLYIGNSGVYQPCCHIQFQTEKPCGSRDELLDIYNSSELVDLRQQLASHNVTNEECRGCLAGARSNASYTKDIGFEGVSSSYKDARQKAEESFSRGETHVEHLPLLLTVYLSYRCNIRCVMCSQALVRDKSMFRDYPTEALQDIFDEVGNGELPFLNLVGGEPMYSRDGIALLEYFGESEDLNTQLGVTTNGTLFRRHRDLLSKISQAN
ncbi:MAG: radical SAM/SPASM domain-containing protein, partial [Actinomycetota bacterium]|nr:radical SAM/SPASM domain-containing protein [Actinomycetota bacterium]